MKYVVTGRDRREDEGSDVTPLPFNRKVMGRKGIGKFRVLVSQKKSK